MNIQKVFSGQSRRLPKDCKHMMRRQSTLQTGLFIVVALTGALVLPAAGAKTKHQNDVPQDRIDILSNVPIAGGPITRVTVTQHYSRSYLYVEHASHVLTLLDVTDGKHPSVVGNFELPATESGSVLTAAGDTALVSSDSTPPAALKTKTMTIVNFADRAHPQTVRQCANVNCTALDDHRGLVFVANDEGLWILHRNPAEDPEVQERYAHDVLYNH